MEETKFKYLNKLKKIRTSNGKFAAFIYFPEKIELKI